MQILITGGNDKIDYVGLTLFYEKINGISLKQSNNK